MRTLIHRVLLVQASRNRETQLPYTNLSASAHGRKWHEPPWWLSVNGVAGNGGTADRDLRS
jgi:hypothetical protein